MMISKRTFGARQGSGAMLHATKQLPLILKPAYSVHLQAAELGATISDLQNTMNSKNLLYKASGIWWLRLSMMRELTEMVPQGRMAQYSVCLYTMHTIYNLS